MIFSKEVMMEVLLVSLSLGSDYLIPDLDLDAFSSVPTDLKFILKLDLHDDKDKRKAVKIVSALPDCSGDEDAMEY